MPLVEDYRAALDSEVADISHVSRDRSISGGSITAALFLREFAGARRWVHLDIAGPARADRAEHEVTKGGDGLRRAAAAALAGEPCRMRMQRRVRAYVRVSES